MPYPFNGCDGIKQHNAISICVFLFLVYITIGAAHETTHRNTPTKPIHTTQATLIPQDGGTEAAGLVATKSEIASLLAPQEQTQVMAQYPLADS